MRGSDYDPHAPLVIAIGTRIVVKHAAIYCSLISIDVPSPLINDLCMFLFQKIDAEFVKCASQAGASAFFKAFILNENECLKPFF